MYAINLIKKWRRGQTVKKTPLPCLKIKNNVFFIKNNCYQEIFSAMDIIRILLIGIVIGMANVIPGVSGSTMAVIFNIYDKFVNAITLNVKKLFQNRRFVVPIICGMAIGVLLFSKLISFLYTNFPVQTNYFFTGLILGSIPLLFNFMAKTKDGGWISSSKIVSVVVAAVLGIAVIVFFTILGKGTDSTNAIAAELPVWTFPLALHIFAAGFVGAIAMIIPGISGSLLMLIMGVYPIVMKSIPSLFNPELTAKAFCLLLPNGIGVLIGLLCGAWIVKTFLKIAPNQTYALIFGLVVGSIYSLFPGFAVLESPLMAIACVLCTVAGAAMAYFSSKISPEEEKTEE